MKAIKKINNNVAICVDGNGNELIAFGKGLGFPQMPYEIDNLDRIEMTFYKVSEQFMQLLQEIPEEIFQISAKVVQRANKILNKSLNPNVVFSLADHLNFAIERMQKYQKMKFAFSYDVEQLYPVESELGRYTLELMQRELYISLPKAEITSIALHFVQAEDDPNIDQEEIKLEKLMDKITEMLEQDFQVKIMQEEFNYNRFVSHIRYLLKRMQEGQQFMDTNESIVSSLKAGLPEVYQEAKKVAEVIAHYYHVESSEEELAYLMIHINRILEQARQKKE
ncbi:BglG family transcriptional antiterminator [Breznakia blatticola]|uniref:BglG family transcriptional antiterminator n=1 Tax=Breznakia blatticola TaxID=1754012 RepID=A0A4R7Z8Q2_9FIRM|nr:PRD domain-containing protein [Breznakia blatticola]TDW11411.1 BglG family transcriptional antiterminator [Breznakia blatticola]